MTLVVTLLLLLCVLAFVGYPLMQSVAADGPPPPAPAEGQREQLLLEREHALAALKDLDLEHNLGNLSDADYAALRNAQRHKALTIFRELDRAEPTVHVATDVAMSAGWDDTALDARLEEEIARARRRLSAVPGPERPCETCPDCGALHASSARYCAECGRRFAAATACPACGSPRDAGAAACGHCGTPFQPEPRD